MEHRITVDSPRVPGESGLWKKKKKKSLPPRWQAEGTRVKRRLPSVSLRFGERKRNRVKENEIRRQRGRTKRHSIIIIIFFFTIFFFRFFISPENGLAGFLYGRRGSRAACRRDEPVPWRCCFCCRVARAPKYVYTVRDRYIKYIGAVDEAAARRRPGQDLSSRILEVMHRGLALQFFRYFIGEEQFGLSPTHTQTQTRSTRLEAERRARKWAGKWEERNWTSIRAIGWETTLTGSR